MEGPSLGQVSQSLQGTVPVPVMSRERFADKQADGQVVKGSSVVFVDRLVRKHTAFPNLVAMLCAQGGYRPTLRTCSGKTNRERAELRRIADAYDVNQALVGDSRRAYRD